MDYQVTLDEIVRYLKFGQNESPRTGISINLTSSLNPYQVAIIHIDMDNYRVEENNRFSDLYTKDSLYPLILSLRRKGYWWLDLKDYYNIIVQRRVNELDFPTIEILSNCRQEIWLEFQRRLPSLVRSYQPMVDHWDRTISRLNYISPLDRYIDQLLEFTDIPGSEYLRFLKKEEIRLRRQRFHHDHDNEEGNSLSLQMRLNFISSLASRFY